MIFNKTNSLYLLVIIATSRKYEYVSSFHSKGNSLINHVPSESSTQKEYTLSTCYECINVS